MLAFILKLLNFVQLNCSLCLNFFYYKITLFLINNEISLLIMLEKSDKLIDNLKFYKTKNF
jgi:hypothetical protein